MSDPVSTLSARLGPAAAFATAALEQVRHDASQLPVLFPQLPRRCGRDALGGGRTAIGGATVDLDGWRRCDAVAFLLLQAADPAGRGWFDLYAHGDIEERAMLLRALALLPLGPATVQLLGEVQRTNMVLHFEAALCDSDLLVRLLGQHGCDRTTANRLLLKLAFLDLPLRRVFGAERLANEELSRMLQDLATEREAAGRAVWRDTWRMIGLAPCAGSTARLVGGIEHGDDGVRLAAAEGLLSLGRADLRSFAQERLPREPRQDVRAVLQRFVDGAAS